MADPTRPPGHLQIAGVLSTHGLQVMTAPHGQRGLELAQAHRPDLIVTDWMMPVMAGPDLIQSIRRDEVLRATPVVLLTAKSDEESKLAGAGMGADAFLGKPFFNLLKGKFKKGPPDAVR